MSYQITDLNAFLISFTWHATSWLWQGCKISKSLDMILSSDMVICLISDDLVMFSHDQSVVSYTFVLTLMYGTTKH